MEATRNSARTIFSASPCHLEVREEALMLKKVALASWARAYAAGGHTIALGTLIFRTLNTALGTVAGVVQR